MASSIKLVVKPTAGGEKIELENIDATIEVAELKTKLAEHCSIPAGEQRLIFKGQILKDERTLESYSASLGRGSQVLGRRETFTCRQCITSLRRLLLRCRRHRQRQRIAPCSWAPSRKRAEVRAVGARSIQRQVLPSPPCSMEHATGDLRNSWAGTLPTLTCCSAATSGASPAAATAGVGADSVPANPLVSGGWWGHGAALCHASPPAPMAAPGVRLHITRLPLLRQSSRPAAGRTSRAVWHAGPDAHRLMSRLCSWRSQGLPADMSAMMNHPMTQVIMNNPQLMQTMLNSNPAVQQARPPRGRTRVPCVWQRLQSAWCRGGWCCWGGGCERMEQRCLPATCRDEFVARLSCTPAARHPTPRRSSNLTRS